MPAPTRLPLPLPRPGPPPPCSTFAADAKLAALGWRERTPWQEGLAATVAWYAAHGADGWWEPAAVEAALEPHPLQRLPAMPAAPPGAS